MNTYKDLSKFLLHCIEDEGKLDMQNHMGSMVLFEDINENEIAEHFFGGKVVFRTESLDFSNGDILFYVYDHNDYYNMIAHFFTMSDMFIVEDVDGQRVCAYIVAE